MTITIKRAVPPDCQAVLGLRTELFEGEMKLTGKTVEINAADKWRLFHDTLGFLLDPNSILLMAMDGEKAVGMVALQAGPTFGMLNRSAVSVVWLYVKPEYRNGEATALLIREGEKALNNQDRNVLMQCAVRVANTEVMEAIKRLGYNPVAVVLEKNHERRH